MAATHQDDKTFETKIIVKECKVIHSGNQRSGGTYTMYQLIATKPDGAPIPLNLRSFEDFPLNEVVDVTSTPFVSESYGTSYTIKRKGLSDSEREIENLKKRLTAIESKLGITPGGSSAPAVPPPPATGTAPPPLPNTSAGGSGGQAF
jgi:hypothetical protein